MTKYYSIVLLMVAVAAVFPRSALAGEQYCDDWSPYYIEEIPFGYAIVRGAWADYCGRNFCVLEDCEQGDFFICHGVHGGGGYKLTFRKNNAGDLLMGGWNEPESDSARFYPCAMQNHDTSPD